MPAARLPSTVPAAAALVTAGLVGLAVPAQAATLDGPTGSVSVSVPSKGNHPGTCLAVPSTACSDDTRPDADGFERPLPVVQADSRLMVRSTPRSRRGSPRSAPDPP